MIDIKGWPQVLNWVLEHKWIIVFSLFVGALECGPMEHPQGPLFPKPCFDIPGHLCDEITVVIRELKEMRSELPDAWAN